MIGYWTQHEVGMGITLDDDKIDGGVAVPVSIIKAVSMA